MALQGFEPWTACLKGKDTKSLLLGKLYKASPSIYFMVGIRIRNVEKVLEDMQSWKIAEKEKKEIPKFVAEYRSGRITRRIGKDMEGNMEFVIYRLKIPLEFIKKSLEEASVEDLKSFMDSLLSGKLKVMVRKNVNGKLKAVEDRPYTPEGKRKFIKVLKRYVKFRLKKKPEKLNKFLEVLDVIITKEEIDPECLSEEEENKLYEASGELWQKFFHEVNSWGGFRAGEFHQLLESDIKLPNIEKGEDFVKILIRNATSKTKGRMITLYGPRCHKVVREYLEKRKREGLKSNEPVFEKGYNATKIWLIRFGKKVLGKNLHHHLYRHTCATWLIDKKIITDRHRLCLFFGWKFSSPMPDIYLTRSRISMDDTDKNVKTTELEEVRKQLEKERQLNRLDQETLSKNAEVMKDISTAFANQVMGMLEVMRSNPDAVKALAMKDMDKIKKIMAGGL